MTAQRTTNTQRHAALRERKRAAGLQRRTVWLTPDAMSAVETIREHASGLTFDQICRNALVEYARGERYD